jgi:hypothetical protein
MPALCLCFSKIADLLFFWCGVTRIGCVCKLFCPVLICQLRFLGGHLKYVVSTQANPSDQEHFPFMVLGNKVDLDDGKSRVVSTYTFGIKQRNCYHSLTVADNAVCSIMQFTRGTHACCKVEDNRASWIRVKLGLFTRMATEHTCV